MKYLFFITALVLFSLTSCQKDEYPDIRMEPAPPIPLVVDSVGVETITPDSL